MAGVPSYATSVITNQKDLFKRHHFKYSTLYKNEPDDTVSK